MYASEPWMTGGANWKRTGRSYPWSREAIACLRRWTKGNVPYKVIARRLGRSYTSVQQMGRKIGIRRIGK